MEPLAEEVAVEQLAEEQLPVVRLAVVRPLANSSSAVQLMVAPSLVLHSLATMMMMPRPTLGAASVNPTCPFVQQRQEDSSRALSQACNVRYSNVR